MINTTSISPKSLLGGLFVSFFLFSLFLPVFQAQAVAGESCATTVCSPAASCKSLTDVLSTPPPAIEGGICTGPCTLDTECASIAGVPPGGLGWGGAKCTGSPEVGAIPAVNGVCLELPRSDSRLQDAAPATSGAGLLTLVDTVTNWIFAIFTVLSIIFILLSAFQFVTAGGDAEKVSEARQKLIWAAVGIIIALLAKGIVPVIRSIVGG